MSKTYAEFFRDESRNPLGSGTDKAEVIERLYRSWRVTEAAPTAAELFSQVLNQFEDQSPGGIVVLIKESSGPPCLRVLHGMRKYPGPLARPTALSKRTFAYQDEVNARGSAVVVEFTEELLAKGDEVIVYKDEQHKAKLAAEDEPETVVAPTAVGDEAEKVTVRKAAFVPFDLVSCLIGQNYSASQAYLKMDTALKDSPLRPACQALLTFLKVASTLTTGDSVAVALDKVCEPFGMETGLDQYMYERVLLRDLTHFRPDSPQAGNNFNMATMQATLQALADRELARGGETTAAGNKETTLVDTFGEDATRKLLALCHKETVEELPSVYHRLAERKRNTNEVSIIQAAFDSSLMALNLPGHLIVTPAIMQSVKQFRFHGSDVTNLHSGVLPMSFVPPGVGSEELRERRNEDMVKQFNYNTMMGTNSQLITSSDAMFLNKGKGYVPQKWPEAEAQLESYQAVLHCLLGAAHPMTQAYVQGWRYYRRIRLHLQHRMDEEKPILGPALLVFIFQSQVRTWLEDQWDEYAVDQPPPDFVTKFKVDFMAGRNLNWLPSVRDIPALYALEVLSRKVKQPPPSIPEPPTKVPKPPSNKKKASGSEGQSRVVNYNVDPRLREDNPMCRNIQQWKISKALAQAGDERPLRTDGKEMCIAWRGKGSCFSSCNRKEDHEEESSEENKNIFMGWCRKGYA